MDCICLCYFLGGGIFSLGPNFYPNNSIVQFKPVRNMIPFIVVALFFLGLLIGYLFIRNRNKFRKFLDSGVNWTIYLLLFLLGISVGRREEILNNFSKIGFDAIVLALGAILGSLLLAFVVYKWFFEKKS